MTAPIYGAKYAVIGSGLQMPQILALTVELGSAKKVVKMSGWSNNPTVKIYELVEVQ
jgi:hypothetical protein